MGGDAHVCCVSKAQLPLRWRMQRTHLERQRRLRLGRARPPEGHGFQLNQTILLHCACRLHGGEPRAPRRP